MHLSPGTFVSRLFLALFAAAVAACSSTDPSQSVHRATAFESDVPDEDAGTVFGAPGPPPFWTDLGVTVPPDDDVTNTARDAQRAIAEADMIQLAGDRLYALSRIAGLSVIDVRDPAQPTLLGRYREVSGEPFELYLRGDVVLAMFSGWGEYVEQDPHALIGINPQGKSDQGSTT